MPVEAKPLFRPDVLRPHLSSFSFPDNIGESRKILSRWAELFATARASKFKESELLPDFLTDVFTTVLGYVRPADSADRYTISRETHVQVDGKFADAVLASFHHGEAASAIVALEGKGPLDPLDRPFAGRKMSAVDQGYRYAINLPCDWIIVTSMRQTRLYYKGADQYTYERFDIDRLATDDAVLKRFLFLLGAARVVPEHGRCHFYSLLTSSEKVGKELTKEFYFRYSEMRHDIFEQLCAENSDRDRAELLGATQKLLDRVLFVAFCEDRGLLPAETIERAYEHRDPYHPRPVWANFQGLFRAIDTGNAGLNIPAYNGGLFAPDAGLDDLKVSDAICHHFQELSGYDYRPPSDVSAETDSAGQLVDVDILGHIFEQSISDLERLRNVIEGREEPIERDKFKTRRKKEGAFYTPEFITRYIVEQALGSVIRERFEQLRERHATAVKGAARAALGDPAVYDLETLKKPQRDALISFWEAWQDELKTVRILDPACGSGAFLIQAFDQLHTVYQLSNQHLEDLRGSRSLFDPDRQILQENLYGVDLNEEAIEICRLSLWIKTAARGKVLTSLDHTIRVGNSVVSDPAVHPRAFSWQEAFPEVFANGGFDVVVGNPPYVRQEWIADIKPYLQKNYNTFHGAADLYVYFYELGSRVLKAGGKLSYVVTNKWMKAGYGEPLRRYFTEAVWPESVIDFGHAKQIFEDADVFPSIIVVRKPIDQPKPSSVRVCAIPRDTLRVDDLSRQIEAEGFEIPLTELGQDTWQLEPRSVSLLMKKIGSTGVPMKDFAEATLYRGIVTGFNSAFCIDEPTKRKLIDDDPNCECLIRPFIRGQDIGRWCSEWAGTWMLFIRKGTVIDNFPSVKSHLEQFRTRLEPKPRDWRGDWKGRASGNYEWFELQTPVEYWEEFAKPKLVYQEIQFHPRYSLDTSGCLATNKVFILPTSDLYLLAVLNSPLMWWHNWRFLPHMKDEALSPAGFLMETLPIAKPSAAVRESVEHRARRLIEITSGHNETRKSVLDWLKIEYDIDKPSMKLQDPISLDPEDLIAEVKKLRGKSRPLTAAALKALREEDARSLAPARSLALEAKRLEGQISDLVNEAYGLTPEEVQLMWDTAPPRMPITNPCTQSRRSGCA